MAKHILKKKNGYVEKYIGVKLEKLKIIQLFKIYFPDNGGGIAVTIKTVASFFCAQNQEIVACHERAGRKTEDDVYGGVKIHRCRHYGFQPSPLSWEFLRDAVKRIRKSDIVIYHYPYPFTDLALLLSGRFNGKRRERTGAQDDGKLIVWWHCDVKKMLQPFYHLLVRHTLEMADIVIVSSKNNLRMTPLLRKYREKCHIIPFCVSDVCLERGKKSLEKRLSKEQNESNGNENIYEATEKQDRKRVSILFVGRLVWYKGVDILLKAYAKMEYMHKELVILGDGSMRKKWEKLASDLKLENVCFMGSVTEEEKWQTMERCSFLVLPSIAEAEAFGLVQIEAMAFGKSVINTALRSGVPEVGRDGVTGITVRPKDVDALAIAMDRLACDEKLRRRYGNNARKLVEKMYTKERMEECFFSAIPTGDRERYGSAHRPFGQD